MMGWTPPARYLGRISKRGNTYLRCLLVHGARAVLLAAQRAQRNNPAQLSRLQRWAIDLHARVGHNKTAVALANKLARIVWAVWSRRTVYLAQLERAATN
jgi:transposase